MDDKSKKALKGCGIGCLGLIFIIVLLVVVLVSCSADGEEKSFGFTVDEYEATLKEVIVNYSNASFITNGGKFKSAENQYTITLTDGIFCFIYVDEDTNVTRVNTVASGGALILNNKEVQLAFRSLIESVDPSLSPTQIMTILDNLGINGKGAMLDQETSYTLNGIYYLYQGNVETDTMALQAKPE